MIEAKISQYLRGVSPVPKQSRVIRSKSLSTTFNMQIDHEQTSLRFTVVTDDLDEEFDHNDD